jgi:hypothetical protein
VHVGQGAVAVFDFKKKKQIDVPAGHTYLASKP